VPRRPRRPRRPRQPFPDQLVFPNALRVGDVILDGATRETVVTRPVGISGGLYVTAKIQREGETVAHEAVWEAWRKLRVVRAG
jgi:hypothetical protein